MDLVHLTRHGRACPGHPRLRFEAVKTWMPGIKPGMTERRQNRPSRSVISDIRMFCAWNARAAVARAAQVHYLERLHHPPE